MPTVLSGDHTIHYTVHGTGDPIILLHGVFTSGMEWIEEGYGSALHHKKLICIDLRGHGLSSKPVDPDAYLPQEHARDVIAVMDGEGLEQAIVWGYSFGARMAFATALYYPHRVTRVVMGGMHPYSVSNVHSAVRDRQSVIRQGMDAWVAHLDSRGIPLPEHRRRMLLANDHQALVAVDDSILSWQGFDDLDRFCGLNIPLLLYLGSRDRSYLPQAQQFASSCDQAQLVKLEGFNHFTALFDSDAVIAAIGSYLS